MELTPAIFDLLRLIYPLPSKSLTRDRPLRILALGLSRSGTDSLQQALVQLGYAECHHGFRYIMDASEPLPWIRLALSKRQGKTLQPADFDLILGDCAVVTDTPGYVFAQDLLTAYPDAKVIVNYREDVEAWHQSVEKTVNSHNRLDWSGWVQTFFDSYLFWMHHVGKKFFFESQFDFDFEKNGRRWYAEHYRSLEERLERDGRQFLRWKVQDGWDPLCAFLEEKTPKVDFPNGNAPAAFLARMDDYLMSRKARANRNMMLFFGTLVVASAILAVQIA